MPQIIQRGKELVRINTQKNSIEYSTTGGRSWSSRYTGSGCGTFYDLIDYGKEILCCSSKGIYYSANDGRTWNSRYTGSGCGTFNSLSFDGKYLLATTSKGLYYSSSGGRTWSKR